MGVENTKKHAPQASSANGIGVESTKKPCEQDSSGTHQEARCKQDKGDTSKTGSLASRYKSVVVSVRSALRFHGLCHRPRWFK